MKDPRFIPEKLVLPKEDGNQSQNVREARQALVSGEVDFDLDLGNWRPKSEKLVEGFLRCHVGLEPRRFHCWMQRPFQLHSLVIYGGSPTTNLISLKTGMLELLASSKVPVMLLAEKTPLCGSLDDELRSENVDPSVLERVQKRSMFLGAAQPGVVITAEFSDVTVSDVFLFGKWL